MKTTILALFLSACGGALNNPIPAGATCQLGDQCAEGYSCGCKDGDDICDSGLACIPAGSFGTACLPDGSCIGGGCINGVCTIDCANDSSGVKDWCPNTFECVKGVCVK